jgi:hypothetical protein
MEFGKHMNLVGGEKAIPSLFSPTSDEIKLFLHEESRQQVTIASAVPVTMTTTFTDVFVPHYR